MLRRPGSRCGGRDRDLRPAVARIGAIRRSTFFWRLRLHDPAEGAHSGRPVLAERVDPSHRSRAQMAREQARSCSDLALATTAMRTSPGTGWRNPMRSGAAHRRATTRRGARWSRRCPGVARVDAGAVVKAACGPCHYLRELREIDVRNLTRGTCSHVGRLLPADRRQRRLASANPKPGTQSVKVEPTADRKTAAAEGNASQMRVGAAGGEVRSQIGCQTSELDWYPRRAAC